MWCSKRTWAGPDGKQVSYTIGWQVPANAPPYAPGFLWASSLGTDKAGGVVGALLLGGIEAAKHLFGK